MVGGVELLVLDFDGVISDSAPESWVVTVRTYAELRPGAGVDALLADLDRLSAPEIQADSRYRRFVEMMPLGNRAEDFGVALGLLLEERDVFDQASFDRAYAKAGAGFASGFHERFYETRARFRDGDPERWVSLLGPYPAFVEILRRHAADVGLAIATAKDRASVETLLVAYGIDDIFPAERVVDKEAGRSKRSHLMHLHERLGVSLDQIVFVDDKVNHLDDVRGIGVDGVLAAWGYNGSREQRLAHERGHRVCTVEGFEAELFA
jgi:phosphoglycolate phosphatase-like HAD superfamily hydrolase